MTLLMTINDIYLQLAHMSKPLLKNIKYNIYEGDFIIILGSNGSGKSSLLKLLSRFYQPNFGQIDFLGKNISNYSDKELSKNINLLTQQADESLFGSMTVFENYLLVAEKKLSRNQHKIFLKEYLLEFNERLSEKLDCLVQYLSGGEKQALALALATLVPPRLLLLDEHTSALDPHGSEQIMQLTAKIVLEHQLTCLLTTHDIDIALRFGNRILAMRDGEIHRLIEDKAQFSSEDLLRVCY